MIESKLSEILGRKRIKMSELARLAGVNKNTVLNLYHGRSTRIEFEVLNKLCNILECSPADILHHTPDLDSQHLAAGRFGAPIPSMDKVIKVGEDEYIDAEGNKFSGDTIRVHEALGGGFERVSGKLYDDPHGLNDTYNEDDYCKKCENLIEDCECEELKGLNQNG